MRPPALTDLEALCSKKYGRNFVHILLRNRFRDFRPFVSAFTVLLVIAVDFDFDLIL